MTKEAFAKLPKWKQNRLKIALQLFWNLLLANSSCFLCLVKAQRRDWFSKVKPIFLATCNSRVVAAAAVWVVASVADQGQGALGRFWRRQGQWVFSCSCSWIVFFADNFHVQWLVPDRCIGDRSLQFFPTSQVCLWACKPSFPCEASYLFYFFSEKGSPNVIRDIYIWCNLDNREYVVQKSL